MKLDYAELITSHQRQLFNYIYSLLGTQAVSWDVLQETNLVLWRKKDEFQLGTNFAAWAFTIARFQTMAFLRDQKRDPLTVMTPDLVELFSEELVEEEQNQNDARLAALPLCLEQLQKKSRQLLDLYYTDGMSLEQVGDKLNSKPNAVKQSLFRIRRKLQDCIDLKTVNTRDI